MTSGNRGGYYWRRFLTITIILLGIGLLMVPSASVAVRVQKYGIFYYFIRQFIYILIGLGVLWLAYQLPVKFWRKFSFYLYILLLLLLLVVLVRGSKIGGARRWLDLGFFNFQPSQLMKLVLILVLANYLDRKRSRLKNFSALFFPLLITFIPIVLIARQPDIGIPALLFLVMLVLLFWAGVRLRYLFLFFLLILRIMSKHVL